MKKLTAALAGATLALTLGGTALATPAQAAPAPTKYASCAKLTAKHPGGVAKTAKTKNTKTVKGKKVPAKSTRKPTVNKTLYTKNTHLDRDKDGIACEN